MDEKQVIEKLPFKLKAKTLTAIYFAIDHAILLKDKYNVDNKEQNILRRSLNREIKNFKYLRDLFVGK
jgi:hypothetical protein